MKFKYLLLGTLSIGMIAAGWAGYQFEQFRKQPLTLKETQLFKVPKGSNIRSIANELQAKGLLVKAPFDTEAWMFEINARLNKQAHRIKAGEYELRQGMTPDVVLETFVSGASVQYQLSIIEGKSYKRVLEKVKQHPNITQTLTDADYQNLMQVLETGQTNPEGWFFPDTYHFPNKTTDKDFLQRSYQMMDDYLQQAWKNRTPHPNIKTPYEALILASIVEKETGVPEERPLIARVFLNRLEKNMLLQTDPTVIYGMGDSYDGNIRKSDLRRDTPYNTYTRKGLTPTPIAIPSKAAIDAVMHPVESDALFFVATGNGGHKFSKTYKEHQRAVREYLRELRKQKSN